jgi:PTH1 family peptidyl-tRNA hydrolase
VSSWGKEKGIRIRKRKFSAKTGSGIIDGEDVFLALPQTYMNRSGLSVLSVMRHFKMVPEDIIIVYDDIDLVFGKLRIRIGGSSGGHRGVQSIIDTIDAENFVRVRMGIGRPHGGEGDLIDFVLSPFSFEEKERLDDIVRTSHEALSGLLCENVETVMNRFNR